jgi:hypothetical protein
LVDGDFYLVVKLILRENGRRDGVASHRVQWMGNIDAARGGVLEFTLAIETVLS